jgi:catechol-2,3-dioxygenase
MIITYLELPTQDLIAQRDFYSDILGLPVNLSPLKLEVKAGKTDLVFTRAAPDFDGAYHFAFNIPENHFQAAKAWISERIPLLRNEVGTDEYNFINWNAHALYFKDATGNILEFIARHNLKNASEDAFDSSQILQVSEIGLPSPDVVAFANELCTQMGLTVFRAQQPDKEFTPLGDDNGLFIVPVVGRLWLPTHNPGIPAKLLPVRVKLNIDGKDRAIDGVPYEIHTR